MMLMLMVIMMMIIGQRKLKAVFKAHSIPLIAPIIYRMLQPRVKDRHKTNKNPKETNNTFPQSLMVRADEDTIYRDQWSTSVSRMPTDTPRVQTPADQLTRSCGQGYCG